MGGGGITFSTISPGVKECNLNNGNGRGLPALNAGLWDLPFPVCPVIRNNSDSFKPL